MNHYKNAKRMASVHKFETNHTLWTNTKPLTGKILSLYHFFRINEAFWERVLCQLLETFQDKQVRNKSIHLFKALYLEKKNSLHHMIFFIFVEEVRSESSK